MLEDNLKIVLGALLHDIGKVIYRTGEDHRKHGQSGYDFIREETGIRDKAILDCIRYHHADTLRHADLEKDSFAYIVYMADNISSSVDRRNKEDEAIEEGFEIHTPLQPVFNILNGASKNNYYQNTNIVVEEEINYPQSEKHLFNKDQYNKIMLNIKENLKGVEFNEEYINSLLEILEANLAFIPSSTSKKEIPDISLYDHLKLTAAISISIKAYLDDQNISDYKDILFTKGNTFYSQKAFRLISMDVSGIQKFIYTISTKNALKTLRARSFYLEILMEHMIDELLIELGLSRTNLIYSGGGHCYLIAPNTEKSEEIFDEFLEKVNEWFLENFDISLYIAGASVACSSDDLKNIPEGSYENLFKTLSKNISLMKSQRYRGDQIIELNRKKPMDYSRECLVCKRMRKINDEGRCEFCERMERFSTNILYDEFFLITDNKEEGILPLPGGYYVSAKKDGESLRKSMLEASGYIRAYGKNKAYTGKHIATKLWVGDYSNGTVFEDLANSSEGIKKVGILRADVDNLGQAFVSGFKNKENNDRYVTLSRVAALSRQLSLFFKHHINKILKSAEFTLKGEKGRQRKATIVYSGGDDIFIVGAWNDVIELAVDIREKFKKYTDNTLTISAGIGVYGDSYPISSSAFEVEAMVDKSKALKNKDGITLLEDGEYHHDKEGNRHSDGTYSWDDFIEKVVMEKFNILSGYMSSCGSTFGNSFLYHLLELIRRQEERINFARYVYFLSRMEPEDTDKESKEKYRQFSAHMVEWVKDPEDRRHLKTAIELYVYLNRDKEER